MHPEFSFINSGWMRGYELPIFPLSENTSGPLYMSLLMHFMVPQGGVFIILDCSIILFLGI